MKTVAIYARVSTEQQKNENQLADLREFAGRQSWEIVAEFVDTVTGSGKMKRPEFEKMMVAASQRKFDILLFWKLDRLSREGVRKTLTYLEHLDEWGVAWRSFTEPYLDSCGVMRDTVISVMATMAQQERISISERTKAGLRRARANGKILGHPRLAIDDRIRELRASGVSLRAIAKQLGVSLPTVWTRTRQLSRVTT